MHTDRQHITLKEIIWEVTGRCENGCNYCGSKENWAEEIDPVKIVRIAEEIAKYSYRPLEINISGGDPLLLSADLHSQITQILTGKNIKCKILFNPKSLKRLASINITKEIFSGYSWIGLSINTQEELHLAEKYSNFLPWDKITIVTNFNLENVFLYDNIEALVREYNMIWQVQYTTYKDKSEPLAIYNNESALNHLFKKISASYQGNTAIILADNMNNGSCSAGLYSCGILSNGEVIPCLSMRSWVDNIIDCSEGNILELGLKSIWEDCFKGQRYCNFECCKDYCGNKFYHLGGCDDFTTKSTPEKLPEDLLKDIDIFEEKPIQLPSRLIEIDPNPLPSAPITVLYGVVDPHVYVYAVADGGWNNNTTAVPKVFKDTIQAIYGIRSTRTNIDKVGPDADNIDPKC